jgi:hypothetical protein
MSGYKPLSDEERAQLKALGEMMSRHGISPKEVSEGVSAGPTKVGTEAKKKARPKDKKRKLEGKRTGPGGAMFNKNQYRLLERSGYDEEY